MQAKEGAMKASLGKSINRKRWDEFVAFAEGDYSAEVITEGAIYDLSDHQESELFTYERSYEEIETMLDRAEKRKIIISLSYIYVSVKIKSTTCVNSRLWKV